MDHLSCEAEFDCSGPHFISPWLTLDISILKRDFHVFIWRSPLSNSYPNMSAKVCVRFNCIRLPLGCSILLINKSAIYILFRSTTSFALYGRFQMTPHWRYRSYLYPKGLKKVPRSAQGSTYHWQFSSVYVMLCLSDLQHERTGHKSLLVATLEVDMKLQNCHNMLS